MDQRALVFSTDLLLSLVIVAIIFGLSADMIDIYSTQMQDHSARNSLERFTRETADILIKSPGSPYNWEVLSFEEINTPGLSKVNLNSSSNFDHILSYKKVLRLKEDYDELIPGRVFPAYLHISLIIYPVNPVLEPIIIHDSAKISSCREVAVVNRSINCDFRSDYCLLLLNINQPHHYKVDDEENECKFTPKCPHLDEYENHVLSDPTEKYNWICSYFQIDKSQIDHNDYYLLTDDLYLANNAGWILDQSKNPSAEIKDFTTHPLNLNSQIKPYFNDEDYEIFWLHVYTEKSYSQNFNVFIVEVPSDIDLGKLKAEYFQVQPCYFVMKVGILS